MTPTQFLAWLVAPTQAQAAGAWRAAHGDKNFVYYTDDPQIHAFWQSPWGHRLSGLHHFWVSLKPDWLMRSLLTKRWQISWFLRRFEWL